MAVRVVKAQLGDGSEVAVEVDEPDALGIQAPHRIERRPTPSAIEVGAQ